MMVGLKRISSMLGLLAAMTSAGLAQDVAPNTNQLTADAVAGTLRRVGTWRAIESRSKPAAVW